jgi:glyoxylase-like metal-dependent hydrolase (beta-lactamase superfamily II)
VLIRSFPAGAFGTNCYAVAPGPRQECVVVDPGMDAVEPLARLLAEDGLKPVAVVLTHGHLDHTFSVLPGLRRLRHPRLPAPRRQRHAVRPRRAGTARSWPR